MKKIAVVRVRGKHKISPKIKKTLELLKLMKPNHCVIVDNSEQIRGMLEKVKDYVTYGSIDESTLLYLIKKRGRIKGKKITEVKNDEEIKAIVKKILDGGKVRDFMDPVFRLRPPRRGYKNTKLMYPLGDLGPRPDISNLIKRMA